MTITEALNEALPNQKGITREAWMPKAIDLTADDWIVYR